LRHWRWKKSLPRGGREGVKAFPKGQKFQMKMGTQHRFPRCGGKEEGHHIPLLHMGALCDGRFRSAVDKGSPVLMEDSHGAAPVGILMCRRDGSASGGHHRIPGGAPDIRPVVKAVVLMIPVIGKAVPPDDLPIKRQEKGEFFFGWGGRFFCDDSFGEGGCRGNHRRFHCFFFCRFMGNIVESCLRGGWLPQEYPCDQQGEDQQGGKDTDFGKGHHITSF